MRFAAPTLLLLHGFPDLVAYVPQSDPAACRPLSRVAPDLPGFGITVSPDRSVFAYKFDNLAKVIDGFTDAIRLSNYAIYVFDYGAPVGFRLALDIPTASPPSSQNV